jgi:hypothetical protein
MTKKSSLTLTVLGCVIALELAVSVAQGQTLSVGSTSMSGRTTVISSVPAIAGGRPRAVVPGGSPFFGADIPCVVDAPYSAVGTTETTTTFFDGNRVSQTDTVRFFRDSQGRFRSERTLNRPAGASMPEFVQVGIDDPIHGEDYMVDPQHKTYQQFPMPSRFACTPVHPPLDPPVPYMMLQLGTFGRGFGPDPDATTKTVSLGEKTIEGITAVGSRLERTIEAGAVGNQRPITMSAEQWFSRELGVIVLFTQRSSIGTETIYRLQQIAQSEPDAK